MTAHATHEMHGNSLSAYAGLELNERQSAVLAIYLHSPPLTDRGCMARMETADPNAVRPRVSELLEAGLLEECGAVRCSVTGRTVRVCQPTTKARGAL